MSGRLITYIPQVAEYEAVVNSGLFREMEGFSKEFIGRHGAALTGYSNKWVKDPLHQWSRQWEYPFVFREVAAFAPSRRESLTMLDAGSGVTFFPFFLRSRMPASTLWCCDVDIDLEPTVAAINQKEACPVRFVIANIAQTGFPDAYFDCIYCVSVIEHTGEHERITSEFYRLLKPGGLLVATFDIALGHSGDMRPAAAENMIRMFCGKFTAMGGEKPFALKPELMRSGIVTTEYADNVDKNLLPWPRPGKLRQMRSIIRHGRPIHWPPRYTVCGISARKS